MKLGPFSFWAPNKSISEVGNSFSEESIYGWVNLFIYWFFGLKISSFQPQPWV